MLKFVYCLSRKNYDCSTRGGSTQQRHLLLIKPNNTFESRIQGPSFDCYVSPLSNSKSVSSLACTCVGFSLWSRHINPFTRNPAKLPCRQALHLKCTISYPCLVWMQHFSNIKPEGSTQRMAPSTQHIVPPCCFFRLPVLSYCVSAFLVLVYPEMKWKLWVVALRRGGSFKEASFTALCVLVRAWTWFLSRVRGVRWDKGRCFTSSAGSAVLWSQMSANGG